jgi:hypothetical protein
LCDHPDGAGPDIRQRAGNAALFGQTTTMAGGIEGRIALRRLAKPRAARYQVPERFRPCRGVDGSPQ